MANTTKQEDRFEELLHSKLTGKYATGNTETDLRIAVEMIRSMHNTPEDCAVRPLMSFMEQYALSKQLDRELRKMRALKMEIRGL